MSIIISILKNGNVIRKFKTIPANKDKAFAHVYDIAGGMWNGKDEFTVTIEERKD